MNNRSAAVIITVVVILLCGCPGLAFLCFGVTDFIDYYAFNSYIYGITDRTATNLWGSLGLCIGVVFIVIAVVVSVLVLRRKKETPTIPNEPVPPAI